MKNQSPAAGDTITPAASQPAGAGGAVVNPLLTTVEEKNYSGLPGNVAQEALQQPIPEPAFRAPNLDQEKDIFKEEEDEEGALSGNAGNNDQGGGGNGGGAKPKAKQDEAYNEALNDLSPGDKKKAAEKLAKILFAGYQRLHDAGNWLLSISDKKIAKLQMAGELDLSVEVPISEGDAISLGEFLQTYNKQAKTFFVIDPEWRAEVEPVLVRILAKRGHGLTDEQFILYKISEDLSVKGIQGFQMYNMTKSILDFAITESARKRQGGAQPQAPTQPVEQQPTPQPDQPAPAAQQYYQDNTGQQQQQHTDGRFVDAQDHVRLDYSLPQNQGGGNQYVESSQVPQFGDKKLLNKLGAVGRQHRKRVALGTPKKRRDKKKA